MPFTGVIDPPQLAILTAALDDFCQRAGIKEDKFELERAGCRILSLFRQGATTAEALTAAVENELRREIGAARIGFQPFSQNGR